MSNRDSTTTAGEVSGVVTSILRDRVCCFDERDIITSESQLYGLCVAYTSRCGSCDDADVTRLECRVDFQNSHMWVDDLRVADSLQSKGIGRQLAEAAERIALAVGLQTVNVFPLASAGDFWRKMGYTSHLKTARVVTKDLATDFPARPVDHE